MVNSGSSLDQFVRVLRVGHVGEVGEFTLRWDLDLDFLGFKVGLFCYGRWLG